MKEKYLTHKEIEAICDEFMEKLAWVKSDLCLLGNKLEIRVVPDRIYVKEGKYPLGFEIKPGDARIGELERGIGQMACYLPYQIKPYLIISVEQWATVEVVLSLLPWLGIAVYSWEPTMIEIKQKSKREDIYLYRRVGINTEGKYLNT